MKRSMVISLIGRPNVGKSSIFNRLMRRQNKAITHDKPGVTRDRHYGIATFDELHDEEKADAILVDTGGFYPDRVEEDGRNQEEINHNKFFNIMTDHAKLAIDESDLVLFVVDVREGIIPFDETITKYLRAAKKDFWLLVNKFDSENQYGEEAEFYALGLDPNNMHLISASHGLGVDDLKEKIQTEILHFETKMEALTPDLQKGVTPREDVVSKIAIVGAPNAGKSTLLNRLIGSERALVSDIAGTTVDPIEGFFDIYFGEEAKQLEMDDRETKDGFNLLMKDYDDFRKNNGAFFQEMSEAYDKSIAGMKKEKATDVDEEEFEDFSIDEEVDPNAQEKVFNQVFNPEAPENETEEEKPGNFWKSIHIVDTAGIRKQNAVHGFIEEQSVFRALRCITEAEIVVFMIDATKGVSHQDRRLLDIAEDKGKSVIICMNKLDLKEKELKDDRAKREWIEDIRYVVPWLNHCDIIPISAKYNKRISLLKKAIKKTVLIRRKKVPTGILNRFIYGLIDRHSIVLKKTNGNYLKVRYASMLKTNPPTILLFSNRSRGIPENYKRYLKNALRAEFGFDNTPIHLIFRTGTDLEKRMQKVKQYKGKVRTKKIEK